MADQPEKVHYLDGLRGVAAFVVVLFHFFQLFMPAMNMGPAPGRFGEMLSPWFFCTPLFGLVSGPFAVAIFFVLSGYVLSLPFFRSRNRQVAISGLIRRYFRLAVPILLSSLFFYGLMVTGLFRWDWLQSVSEITGAKWMYILNLPPPTLLGTIWDSLVEAVFTGKHHPYNEVLWTMNLEFMGSLFVFGVLLVFGNLRWRFLAYAILFLICNARYPTYLPFLVGLVFCDLNQMGCLNSALRSLAVSQRVLLTIALVLIGFYLGGYPTLMPAGAVEKTFFYGWASGISWLPPGSRKWLVMTDGAACVLLALLIQPYLQQLLSGRVGQFLGKISFGLYLTHFPILFTITVPLFLMTYSSMGILTAAFLSFILSLPVLLVVGWWAYRFMDLPGITVSRWFYQWFYHLVYQRCLASASNLRQHHTAKARWDSCPGQDK